MELGRVINSLRRGDLSLVLMPKHKTPFTLELHQDISPVNKSSLGHGVDLATVVPTNQGKYRKTTRIHHRTFLVILALSSLWNLSTKEGIFLSSTHRVTIAPYQAQRIDIRRLQRPLFEYITKTSSALFVCLTKITRH
jgi:hypothetical protein